MQTWKRGFALIVAAYFSVLVSTIPAGLLVAPFIALNPPTWLWASIGLAAMLVIAPYVAGKFFDRFIGYLVREAAMSIAPPK